MCFVTLLTAHPQIDFNAVGAYTSLNAPAARMRYSRLKRNIENKIGVNIKKGPAASIRGPAMKNTKPAVDSNKKRKASYESGGEASDVTDLDDDVGNVSVKDEGPQEWTFGPNTRGKKIDLTDAFDSDKSTGPEQRNGGNGSSDDYEMEDVSEDEEEFHVDEADKEEDYQPGPIRRKSRSQSANKKTRTAKSAITSFKKSSKPVPRYLPKNYARVNVASPKVPVPVTPERGISDTRQTKGKSVTLPLTPQSIPSALHKQKLVDSTLIKLKPGTGANQLSAAVNPKNFRHAMPQPSLVDRIEKARMQADRNLSYLPDQANKTSWSPNYSIKTDSECILPSIEQDDEEDEGAVLRARSRSSSMSDTDSLSPLYYTSIVLNADDESVDLQANTLATQPVLRETSRSPEIPSPQ